MYINFTQTHTKKKKIPHAHAHTHPPHTHGTHSYACAQVNCHGQYCTQLLLVNSKLRKYAKIS